MVTSSWPRATPAALTRSSSMAQFNQLFEGWIRHVLQALAFMGESAVALVSRYGSAISRRTVMNNAG